MEKVTKEVILHLNGKGGIELSSTHRKLCIPIINRIYKMMSVGIRFSGIKVENSIIFDGHHRYLASLLAGISIERIAARNTSATTTVDWKAVTFEDEDWDTPGENRHAK